jgi:hypothetical protein
MVSLSMAGSAAHASFLLGGGNPPPELLDYASATPTLESSAFASSTYQGSLRVTPCSDSGAFWACRELINEANSSNPALSERAIAGDDSLVSVSRNASAFDYTETTPAYIYSYFADITPATSRAQARTDYGSNKAEAAAWGTRLWTETRVQAAWDPTQSSITGFTRANAGASSTYTEVFTPDKDGLIILNFELKQHPTFGAPPVSGFAATYYDGYGEGSLLVQVFDLDNLTEYGDGSVEGDEIYNPPIEGYVMVAEGSISRDWDESSGSEIESVSFNVLAGNRYSLVSQLQVSAQDNAHADFFGTASLQSILVTPGMNLDIGSGSIYAVAAIPEPQTYALLLAGLGLVGWAARRRNRA